MVLGPGLITGASDDDPSGIGTYTTAGAALGFATLWTAIITLPMMAAVQFICAKIGMVSGRGLSGVLRKYYPGWLVYAAISLLVIANTINAGTDIGAIAAAINLLIPIPAVVSGWLSELREVDAFAFNASKNQKLRIRVAAKNDPGFPRLIE